MEFRLYELGAGSFNCDAPDFTLLGSIRELEAAYVALSQAVDGKEESELGFPRKVGLSNGFALLCLRDGMHEKVFPGLSQADSVRRLRSVAQRRNKSVLAHGKETLSAADSGKVRDTALALARGVLGAGFEDFQLLRRNLRPYELNALAL